MALLTRLVAVPLWRHRFEGHELEYLSAFNGDPWESSTRVYPLLADLYALMGLLFSNSYGLVALNLFASLLGIFAGFHWARKKWGDSTAWMLAILLTLSPTHAFWSTSIYNVTLPQTALLCGLALGGWRGAIAVALACNMRIELLLLAPIIALLSDWRVATGCAAGLCAWPLMGSAPNITPPLEVLPVNMGLTEMLGPLGSTIGLLLLLLALQRHNFQLALGAAAVHLIGSCFDDYGTRHGLFGAFCGMALLASCTGWRRTLAPLACALFVFELAGLHDQVRMTAAHFSSELPELPRVAQMPAECHEILDDPLDERSHWRARKAWPSGTVCWGEERIHRAWTTRGLQDRRTRMHRSYNLKPRAILELESGPRLIYEVQK